MYPHMIKLPIENKGNSDFFILIFLQDIPLDCSKIAPVCLPESEEDLALPGTANITVPGWGQTFFYGNNYTSPSTPNYLNNYQVSTVLW